MKSKKIKEKSKEGEQSASSAANEVVVPDDDSAENEKVRFVQLFENFWG